MPRRDSQTGDLFAVPRAAAQVPASMDFRAVVAHLVTDMIQAGEGDRYAIAGRMSRLVGKDVSKAMLDGYTAESRVAFNLPLYLVPALEAACETTLLTEWLASVRGGRVLLGRDVLAAELGRLERQRDELAEQSRRIRDQLRRGA